MSPPAWPRAVIFDLDGTLVDSAPDLAAALNAILAADGLAPHDLGRVRGFIGSGVTKLVARGYAAHDRPLAGADLTGAVARFEPVYHAGIVERTRPYPGAVDLLRALADRGVPLGICTNKVEALTLALLDGLELRPFFEAIVGGGPSLPAKPAPDMMRETLRRLGCAPAEAVMIGDSPADIEGARAVGVPFVGVTFGYTPIPMREMAPDAAIDHFDEALAALDQLAAKRNTAPA